MQLVKTGSAAVTRRALLKLAPTAAVFVPVVGALFAACSKTEAGADCLDLSALAPQELQMRSNIGYQAHGPKDLTCDKCVHWIAGNTPSCGKCRVMPGPVEAGGYCRLYAPKG
jgi:hypothetical protein